MPMKLISLFFALLLTSLAGISQSYFLQGDANAVGGDCYQLTPPINTQTGAIWYDQQIDLLEPFDLELEMNLGNQDQNGADGICFVLQTVGTNALGTSGGGLGFLGFAPAFAVEFDTWQNLDYVDPTFDHIAMISNGDVSHISANAITTPVQAIEGVANIEDGQNHIVRLIWEPETMVFSVYFDCDLRVSHEIDIVTEIFNGQTTAWWGFTAGTGGSNNSQTVCLQENIITTSPDEELCQGASTILNVGGDTDGTFLWEPSTYLDDPTSQTPVCTPEEDITYTVTYTDLCGFELSAEVNIIVDEVVAEITGETTLNCYNPVTTLNGDNNFGSPSVYNWSTDDGEIDSGENSQNAVISSPGTYTLNVLYDGQCGAEETIEVTADFTTFDVAIDVDGELNCDQDAVPLTGSTNGDDFLFNWTTTNGEFGEIDGLNTTANEEGAYTLTITNPVSGCENESTVNVTGNFDLPVVSIGEADSLSCERLTVEILGTFIDDLENSSIEWSTIEGTIVNGVNQLEPLVSDTGIYTITVTNILNGCSTNASVEVFASEEQDLDLSGLAFPNIISPNGDGKNDQFRPFLTNDPEFNVLQYMPTYELLVYNRWGSLVYETTGLGKQWDGKTNGEDLAPGVYYFIVNYEIVCGSASTQVVNGELQLTR